MILFDKKNELLILIYHPQLAWVINRFKSNEEVLIKNTFYFSRSDLFSSDIDIEEEGIEFILGRLVGNYYKIESRVLGIDCSVFINKDFTPSIKFFIATKDISIFKRISEISKGDIYVGGDNSGAIPASEYARLIKDFPNSYEVRKYTNARVGAVLDNYFDSAIVAQESYERYMNKRKSTRGENLHEAFREVEIFKYETISAKLEKMLENESLYNEKQWQDEILQIILLLYPKYVYVFKEAPVRDFYKSKDRKIDLLLVDSDGHVDIIEIKRPFGKCLVTENVHRDNHIPLKELSGTVMQIEKYIFHLNKCGKKGEDKLTKKYKEELPGRFKLKITNPSGIIIMGRSNKLSPTQKDDFEVIKRKYKNVIDIITYDDLLKRLRSIIEGLKRH